MKCFLRINLAIDFRFIFPGLKFVAWVCLLYSDLFGAIFPTDALKEVTEMTSQLQHSLIRLENFQKLTELQHDLIGIDNLTAPGRVSNFT